MHYQCLIVDDEKALADSTCEYFNLFGVSTVAVYDAKSCLHIIDEHTIDVILLDVNLEETSGFDLCQKLRKKTDILILFISARQSDDYIRKPYSLSILLAKLMVQP